MGEMLDIAAEDMRDIIGDEDEFSTPLLFTPPTGEPFTIHGTATVHSQGIDSDGIPIIADNSHLFFSEVSVNELGYATRNANGKLDIRKWVVDFDHKVGHVKATLGITEPDSTFGMIRVMLQNYKES